MNFSLIIKHAHSGVAYLAIIFLLIAIVNAFAGLGAKKEFKDKDKKLGLFALIFCHIQFLLGIILYVIYFNSVISPISAEGGMGAVMKDSAIRLFAVEHPLINLIAIVLITIGWSKHKRTELGNTKFKNFAIFYTLGLVLILSRIPWSQWL